MIRCRARQVRLNYQQKLGRPVSLSEVARAIGFSRAALSQVEKEETHLSKEMLNKLCWFYGITPGDLLEYVPDELRSLRLAAA